MVAPRWHAVSPAPLPDQMGRAALVDHPRGGGLRMIIQASAAREGPRARVDVWRWDGERFDLEAPALFAQHTDVAGVLAYVDPRRDDIVLCGCIGRGVVCATLARPGETWELVSTPVAPGHDILCGFAGPETLFLTRTGLLLVDREGRLELRADIRASGQNIAGRARLTSAVADPVRDRIVAVDGGGHGFVYAPESGWQYVRKLGFEGCVVAWDPAQGQVVLLDYKEYSSEPMRLVTLCDDELARYGNGPEHDGIQRHVALALDTSRDEWVFYGSRGVAVAPRGRHFSPAAQPLPHHRDAEAALRSETWARTFDRASLYLALAPDGAFAFDGQSGALFHVAPGGAPTIVVPAWSGLRGLRDSEYASSSADRVSMVFDERLRRVVLFHGREGRTWVQDGRAWRKLGRPTLGKGASRLCSTPAGVFAFVAPRLWGLGDEAWRPVGRDGAWQSQELFYDARRARLWSVSGRSLGVWDGGRFLPVTEVPGEPAKVSLDVEHDRLVVSGSEGVFALDLSSCGVTPGRLPAIPQGPPTTARPSDKPRLKTGPSCYALEMSFSQAGYAHAFVFVYPTVDLILACLDQAFCSDDPDALYGRLQMALMGETQMWWVIERGVRVRGIDVRPYVSLRSGRERVASLDDLDALRAWEEASDPAAGDIAFEIDHAGLRAAVPALEGEPLERGKAFVLRDEGALPDAETLLTDGSRLRRGFQDLAGALEPGQVPEFFSDPDKRPRKRGS